MSERAEPGRTAPAAVFTGDAVAYGVPVLRVADAQRSVAFYCGQLGFRQDWWHQAEPDAPAFVSVSRGGATVYLVEHGDVPFGGHACLGTLEMDTLFHEFAARGVTIELAPTDMPWRLTEMHLRDPDGNLVRVTQPVGCADERHGHGAAE